MSELERIVNTADLPPEERQRLARELGEYVTSLLRSARTDEASRLEDYMHTAPLIQTADNQDTALVLYHFDKILDYLVARRAEIAAGLDETNPTTKGGDE